MKAGTPSSPSSPAAAAEIVDRLLHGVADKTSACTFAVSHLARAHAAAPCRSGCGRRGNRCAPSARRARAVRDPARGAAFVEPAEIDELHVEPADRAPPRGTSRPAAGRRCPRSAAGSWWRRARRSAGRAGRPATGGASVRARCRNASISARGDAAAGSLRAPVWTRGRLVAFCLPSRARAGVDPARRAIRWHLGAPAQWPLCGRLVGDQVVGLERLVLGGEPFGARRGAAPAASRRSAASARRSARDLLPRGHMRQVRPRAERGLVEIVERGQAAREELAEDHALGKAFGRAEAEAQRRAGRGTRRPASCCASRASKGGCAPRSSRSVRRSTMRRWRRASRTILA